MNLIHWLQQLQPSPISKDVVAVDISEVYKVSQLMLSELTRETPLEELEAKWFPVVAPPYAKLWLEIAEPARIEGITRNYYAGLLLLSDEELTSSERQSFKDYHALDTVRWRTHISFYFQNETGIRQLQAMETIYIHANGKIALPLRKITRLSRTSLSDSELDAKMDNIYLPPDMRFTLLHALALMHCKNIYVIDQPLTRQQRRQLERKNVDPIMVKTLAVRPTGAIKASTPGFNRLTRLMRHHLVRGHFKTFTPEAPLFGKHVGTYWWESSVRGHSEKGEVKKSYKVYPRSDEDNV